MPGPTGWSLLEFPGRLGVSFGCSSSYWILGSSVIPDDGNSMKQSPMMMVGTRADRASLSGETPPSKYLPRTDWPAGLGALAMTVRPPPVTAPARTAYLAVMPRLGACEAR